MIDRKEELQRLELIEEAYNGLSHPEKRLFARFAGRNINDVPKAIIPMYRVMNRELEEKDKESKNYSVNEDAFFAALTIRCLFEDNDGMVISPEEFVKLGRESKKLASKNSYDNRIEALMTTTEAEFFSLKLGKLMSYTQTLVNGYKPDCERIYLDIKFLNSNEKTVQRRWARKIYS